MSNIKNLEEKSKWLRKITFEMLASAKQGHPGSIFSQIEILTTLFYGGIIHYEANNPESPEKDKIIISKGHAAMGLYPIFSDIGYFEKNELNKFGSKDGFLRIFGNISIPGIDCTSGSLGHGVGVGSGFAYSYKINQKKNKCFVILSEGEMYEGSTWESALFSAHHDLDNLILVLDRNRKIILGDTEDCLALDPIKQKWESFGFCVQEVNGHSIRDLLEAFSKIGNSNSKPLLIIANTIKGKGISFMENDPKWHYWHNIDDSQLELARKELS